MELYELITLLIVGIAISSILLPIIFLKNRRLSKSAKILCESRIKLKNRSNSNLIIRYMIVIYCIAFWIPILYEPHSEGDIISFGITLILMVLIIVILHRYVNKSRKTTDVSKKSFEIIGFDDYTDAKITDKGIMIKNMIWKRWDNFKGYLLDKNHVVLVPKYSWIEPHVYILDEGDVLDVVKHYLKEI